MKSTIFIVISAFFLFVFGFILKRIRISELVKKLNFTIEYNNKFVELINNIIEHNRFSNDIYLWLTEKVHAMQIELGDTGVIHHFVDPLKGIQAREYQLLINFLPEIRSYMREISNSIMMERFDQSVHLCTNMFIRHKGDLTSLIDKENKLLINPFSCLAESIRYIIALPFSILYWLGILSERSLYRIQYSWILKLVNTCVILIGFIGSIITIVLGWDGFVNILNHTCNTFLSK